jgi:hypothetical protein
LRPAWTIKQDQDVLTPHFQKENPEDYKRKLFKDFFVLFVLEAVHTNSRKSNNILPLQTLSEAKLRRTSGAVYFPEPFPQEMSFQSFFKVITMAWLFLRLH